MQALLPFGVDVGVRGDPTADTEHRASGGVELHRADRHVEFGAATGDANPTVPQ